MKNLKSYKAYKFLSILAAMLLAFYAASFLSWLVSDSSYFSETADALGQTFSFSELVYSATAILFIVLFACGLILSIVLVKNLPGVKASGILLSCGLLLVLPMIGWLPEAFIPSINFIALIESGGDSAILPIVIIASAVLFSLATIFAVIFGCVYSAKNAEAPTQPVETVEAEEPEEEPQPVYVEPKEELPEGLDEKIRRIVQEELSKQEPAPMFSAPLVVQYFTQDQKPEEKPAPVVVTPVEEVKEEPAPVEIPVVEDEKKQIIRIPFDERLTSSEQIVKDRYNEIKNEFLSWGLKSRVSSSGDTFRLHRKTYAKITVAGKGLKIYYALEPSKYADSTIPVLDASDKGIYEEIPLVFKVKSDLSVKRAKQLIEDAVAADGLTKEEPGTDNWAKEIAAEVKARNK